MRIGPDGGSPEPVAPPKPKPPPPAPKKSAPARAAARPVAPARSAAAATALRYVPPPTSHYVPPSSSHDVAPAPRVTPPLPGSKKAAEAKAAVDAIGHRLASPLDDIGHFLESLVTPPPKPVALPKSSGYTALNTALPVDPSADRAILAQDEAIATRDEALAKQRDKKQSAGISLGLNQTLAAVKAKTGVIAIPASLQVDPNADLAQYRQARQDAQHDDLIAQEPVQQAKAKLAAAQRALAARAAKGVSAADIAQAERRQIAAVKGLAGLRVAGGELFGGLGHLLGLSPAPSSGKLQKTAAANERRQIAEIETGAKNGTIRREVEQSYVASETTSQQKALALAQAAAQKTEAADARQVAVAKADIGSVNLESDVSTAAKAQATLGYNKIAAQHDADVILQQHGQKLQSIQTHFSDQLDADKSAEIKQLEALPADASKATKLAIVSQTQALANRQQTQAQLEFDAADTAGKNALNALQNRADAVAAGGNNVLFKANAAAFSHPLMDQVAKQESGGQSYTSGAELNNFVVNSYAGQIPGPGESSAVNQYTPQQLKNFGAAIKQIQSIGGQSGKILALPVLYDTGKSVQHTILFQVAKAAGGSRFVDLSGKTYSSIDDFQHNNGIGDGGHLSVLKTTSNLQFEHDANGEPTVLVGKSHIDPGLFSQAVGDVGAGFSFVGGLAVETLKFGAKLATKYLPEGLEDAGKAVADNAATIAEDAAPIVEGVGIDAAGGALEVVTDGAATPLAAMMEEAGTDDIVAGVAEDGARALASTGAKDLAETGTKDLAEQAPSKLAKAAKFFTNTTLNQAAKTTLYTGIAANSYSGAADLVNLHDHGESLTSSEGIMDMLNVGGGVASLGSGALAPVVSRAGKLAEDGETISGFQRGAVSADRALGTIAAGSGLSQMGYQAAQFAEHPSWETAKGVAIGIGQLAAGKLASGGVKAYYEAAADPETAPKLSLRSTVNLPTPTSFKDALTTRMHSVNPLVLAAGGAELLHHVETIAEIGGPAALLTGLAIVGRDKIKNVVKAAGGRLSSGGSKLKQAVAKSPKEHWNSFYRAVSNHTTRTSIAVTALGAGGAVGVADLVKILSPEAGAVIGSSVLAARGLALVSRDFEKLPKSIRDKIAPGTTGGRILDGATALTYWSGNLGDTAGEILKGTILKNPEPAVFSVSNIFNGRRMLGRALAKTGKTASRNLDALHRYVSNPSWVAAGGYAAFVAGAKTFDAVTHGNLGDTAIEGVATASWTAFTGSVGARSVLEIMRGHPGAESYDDIRARKQLGLSFDQARTAKNLEAEYNKNVKAAKATTPAGKAPTLTPSDRLHLDQARALTRAKKLNATDETLQATAKTIDGDKKKLAPDRTTWALESQDFRRETVGMTPAQIAADHALTGRQQSLENEEQRLATEETRIAGATRKLRGDRAKLQVARDKQGDYATDRLDPDNTVKKNYRRGVARKLASNDLRLRKTTAWGLTIAGFAGVIDAIFGTATASMPKPKGFPPPKAGAAGPPHSGARLVASQANVHEFAAASAHANVVGTVQRGTQLQATGKQMVSDGQTYDQIVYGRTAQGEALYGWVLAGVMRNAKTA